MPQQSQSSLRIGTRGSALALWQAETVQKLIAESQAAVDTELVIIKPEGDLDKHSSLRQIGGRGVFTSALQHQMLAGEIDCAVHSTKDLPSLAPHGIAIAAFPQREDSRDALISRHGVGLLELPANPVIGTSSRRRAAQILKLRPDADIRELRGNIDTRLRKGEGDEYDAVILAAAGLRRMGWEDRITALLPVEVSCPAPGQGALAIEARVSPDPTWDIVAALDDPDIRTSVMVERAFLRGVGGGCTTPIGAHAKIQHIHGLATLRFWGMLGSDDGTRLERMYAEWPVDSAMENAFAAADEMMRTVAPKWTGVGTGNPLQDRKVLVTGSGTHVASMSMAMREHGAHAPILQTINIETKSVSIPEDADWLVLTSKHAVPSIDWSSVRSKVAAVGEGTADAVRAAGGLPDLVAKGPGAKQLSIELADAQINEKHVVCVLSDIARPELVDELSNTGARITILVGYINTPVDSLADDLREQIAAGTMEGVTFSSPSGVSAFMELIGADLPALSGAAMFAIGPTTAAAMEEAGLAVHATAEVSTVAGFIETLARYFGGERSSEQRV